MRKHALKFTSLIAMALAVTLLGPARAAADDDDPPSRVARLSVADGSVSFQPAGTQDWVGVVVNRPMTTGDKLWADRDSRAELQIGSGSIRLGANTGFSFLNLDDRTVQLQLTEGTVRIRLRRLSRGEIFEVDTPNLAFTALRPGIYRVNVNEAGDTTVVVVRDGEGEVTGGGQTYSVHADETGIFSGTDQLNADIEGVGSDDDLERWSYERGRLIDTAIGSGSRPGDIRGSMMSRGALLHSITDDGSLSAGLGVGCRVDRQPLMWCTCARFMHPRLSLGWVDRTWRSASWLVAVNP